MTSWPTSTGKIAELQQRVTALSECETTSGHPAGARHQLAAGSDRPAPRSSVRSMIMSTVTRTYLVDDINGSTDDVATIQFSLDNTSYEIDLDAANQERLRDQLAKYLVAAAIAARPQTTTRTASRKARAEAKAIPAGRGTGTDPGRPGLGQDRRL